ncbi:MAG: cobalamin biosynthesis protein [Lachnospiraceae bacterium]|nr:cobalamin biosynthesis protein [Lachnospiraceae bacterium]
MLHIISFTENGLKVGNNICYYVNVIQLQKTETQETDIKSRIKKDDKQERHNQGNDIQIEEYKGKKDEKGNIIKNILEDTPDKAPDCEHMTTCKVCDTLEIKHTGPQYAQPLDSTLSEWTRNRFHSGEQLLFIGACGIAVRSIAPFINGKDTDPAVLVMDDNARYVIPILSGHLGGANETAQLISKITGAVPVITTATDVNCRFAVDLFAKNNDLVIGELGKVKHISAAVLQGKRVDMILDEMVELDDCKTETPKEVRVIKTGDEIAASDQYDSQAIVLISNKKLPYLYTSGELAESTQHSNTEVTKTILQLYPKNLILGVGCKSGKSISELECFLKKQLEARKLAMESVCCIASIDKKAEEKGIIALCQKYNWRFVTFPAELLMKQQGSFSVSEFVRQTVGADNVCERSVMAAGAERLLQRKTCQNGMTLAIGEITRRIRFGE